MDKATRSRTKSAARRVFVEIATLFLGIPVGFMVAFFFMAFSCALLRSDGSCSVFKMNSPVAIVFYAIIGRVFLAWQLRKNPNENPDPKTISR